MSYRFIILTVLFSAGVTAALVTEGRADPAAQHSAYSPQIVSRLKSAISSQLGMSFRQFNNPRIELGEIRLLSGTLPASIQSVQLLSENSRGQAQFAVFGSDQSSAQIVADYAAWIQVRVAARRIAPGERLTADEFNTQETDVATGMPYELRGVLLSSREDVSNLQTRQTILPGQFLVANAVERVPDVRRGDSVRIHLVTGDLSLSTLGTASEPGYANSTIRVVTNSTHRALTGVLQPGGVVEVKL